MTGPEVRCTAYWYASTRGLSCDPDFLLELGRQAARHARWLGIPEQKTPEGPFIVHAWPEAAWDYVAPRSAIAAEMMTAAGRMTRVAQAARPGNREEFTREREPGFWSYPAPPEDTQAYLDWTYMAQEEDRDAGWGPGQVPWDGDDIR